MERAGIRREQGFAGVQRFADGEALWVLGREGDASHLVLLEGGRCHSYAAQPALEPVASVRSSSMGTSAFMLGAWKSLA